MVARHIQLSFVCLSDCPFGRPFVTSQCSSNTAKRRIMQMTMAAFTPDPAPRDAMRCLASRCVALRYERGVSSYLERDTRSWLAAGVCLCVLVQVMSQNFSSWKNTLDDLTSRRFAVPSLSLDQRKINHMQTIKALCSLQTKEVNLIKFAFALPADCRVWSVSCWEIAASDLPVSAANLSPKKDSVMCWVTEGLEYDSLWTSRLQYSELKCLFG